MAATTASAAMSSSDRDQRDCGSAKGRNGNTQRVNGRRRSSWNCAFDGTSATASVIFQSTVLNPTAP